jgi:hypothetical protein
MAESSPEKTLTVTVTHMIPTIGKIEVELFEPAASIYSVFEKTEIKRLQNLSQLGQLIRIHSGAHHTRWDYVMLKLYLLKVFKQFCHGAGLSSEVPSLKLKSGCQAIQAYSLLRNFGHLEGCFETERVVLEICATNARARRNLLGLVPPAFKSWAKDIIEKEQILQFYQLLSVVFTEHSTELQGLPELKQTCLDLLHRFLVKSDNRVHTLKARHREIRTLAYLTLDMHYTPVGLEFNLGSILIAAKEFGQKLFGSSLSRFQRLNTHITNYVSEAVYMSPDSTWAFLEFRNKVYSRYLNRLGRYKTSRPLLLYLRNLKYRTLDWELRKRPVYTTICYPVSFRSVWPEKVISKTKELSTRLRIGNRTRIGLVALPSQGVSRAYIYHAPPTSNDCDIHERFRLLMHEVCALCESSRRLNRKRGLPSFIVSRNAWSTLDSLFRSVLYLATSDEYEIVLERTGVPNWLSGVCCDSRPKAEKEIRKVFKSGQLSGLPNARRAELECVLCTTIESSGGFTAACLSNIKILRKAEFAEPASEYEAAEIDGAVLSGNKRHTKLYLVESKKQHARSSSAARKQLEALFSKKVDLAQSFQPGVERLSR